jgi:hypothetical protein
LFYESVIFLSHQVNGGYSVARNPPNPERLCC